LALCFTHVISRLVFSTLLSIEQKKRKEKHMSLFDDALEFLMTFCWAHGFFPLSITKYKYIFILIRSFEDIFVYMMLLARWAVEIILIMMICVIDY
jgi:hypothetical protein